MSFFTTDQKVLFVDDDDALREANAQALELAGIDVAPIGAAEEALKRIDADFAGIVVSDIRMPRMDGLQLFARIRAIDPEIPVILITGHADVATAIGALKEGAFDFLTKPFAADHLTAAARKALATRRLVLDNRRLRAAGDSGDSPRIGDSPVMARLRDTIGQVARADIDVLVEGETGTGKELVALMLHRQGPRRGKPFVAVNCGALPEALAEAELFGHDPIASPGRAAPAGRIEAASGGPLVLDEVDSMAGAVQAVLLRVLEEREVMRLGGDRPRSVDLRVVAAAKTDLQAAIAGGRFREDLFYRLNVVRLRVPPLDASIRPAGAARPALASGSWANNKA
jgi:two-component system C4-dicarboxylate transport response regulator DctD